jgi:LysM repeat protein
VRDGGIPTRARRAQRRYLHAEQPVGRSGRGLSFLAPWLQRLAPPALLLTITGIVLLGGGFWPTGPTLAPQQTSWNENDYALKAGTAAPDTLISGESANNGAIDLTITVPGGTATTSVQINASDSTFTGYLARPGSIITNVPQRVSIVPARRGDTLETIASRLGSTPTALMWANGITDPTRVLPPGQTVRVPPAGTMLHKVKETDTLDSIARAYQVKVDDVIRYPGNNVQSSSDLVPGAYLLIPTSNVPTRDQVVFYQLREGDSLWKVSQAYGLAKPSTLQWANNLLSLDATVKPGQILAIPPTDGVIHVVEEVDTQRTIDDAVTQIAKNFACASVPCNDPPTDERVAQIRDAIFNFGGNHLTHGGKLIQGQEIMIPGGIPYVAPPPIPIPQIVTIDNPEPRAAITTTGGNTSRGSSVAVNAPLSGSSLIASVAQRHLGEYRQPSGLPWAFWCEKFVGDVAAQAGVGHYRYATALADAYAGPLYHTRAPAGSLVFFDASWSYAGHVGIAMGDGTMISALSNGIVRTAYEGSSGYMGWRPFP